MFSLYLAYMIAKAKIPTDIIIFLINCYKKFLYFTNK